MWTKQQYKACKAKAYQACKKWLKRPWWFQEKVPVARFTGYVGLYTLVLAVVAGLQTCILSNQLDEMRDDKRPWVYEENAYPWSPLIIKDESAEIVLQFILVNTGKSPARFVNIQGEFFYSHGATSVQIYSKWKRCEELRNKTVVGTAIFPGQKLPHNGIFVMDKDNVAEWRNQKPESPGALLIIGCVDYVFGDGTTHHQTKFIFELDRPGPNRTYLLVEPTVGQIPAAELVLAVNPTLAKDAD